MTPPIPAGPGRAWRWLLRAAGHRRWVLAALAGLGLVGGTFAVLQAGGSATSATTTDAVPVPRQAVPFFVEAAGSCPALTPPRLAAQVMGASGFSTNAPNGFSGLAEVAWRTWAPWPGAARTDIRANVLALAHLTCDLVGQSRVVGLAGDPWQLAVAASQSSIEAVRVAGGVPPDARDYVDRVVRYAVWYASQPGLDAPAGTAVPPVAAPATRTADTKRSPAPAATTRGPGGSVNAVTKTGSSSGRSVSVGPVRGLAGKCLDVDSSAGPVRARVQLWQCDGSAEQVWSWRTDGTLRALEHCLGVVDQGTAPQTPVRLDNCNGTSDQVWTPLFTKALYNTASGLCLDVPAGVTADGTSLQLWTCNQQDPQKWTLTPGTLTGPVKGPAALGNCLEKGNATNSAGGLVVRIARCTASDAQRWTAGTDGKLRWNNLCLEVINQSTTSAGPPGTAVGVNTCANTRSQSWAPQNNGTITNPVSRLCLDAPGSGAQAGQVRIMNCNGSDGQKWALPVLSG